MQSTKRKTKKQAGFSRNGDGQQAEKDLSEEIPGGSTEASLEDVREAFLSRYYFSDPDVIEVVLGVVAGNHIDTDPIWLHLIGPPSSGKTELLMSLFTWPACYFLSDLTANTLISGYREPPKTLKVLLGGKDDKDKEEDEEEKDFSLLPELNRKVLVTKDFSLIHEKPWETRAQILSVLRDVYDGYSSKRVGNNRTKGYKSRFNYLTGMTPDIEKSWNVNTLGERFLLYRIQIKDRMEHARQALRNARDGDKGSEKIRSELQAIVHQFLSELPQGKVPTVSDEMIELILSLAEVLSTCRTYVHREKNDDITSLPQAELASRVSKQLMRVGQSLALVRGKDEVTADEFNVMKRIAMDSLPAVRRLLLYSLWNRYGLPEPLEIFAHDVNIISKTTVRRELENLMVLGAVRKTKVQETVESKKKKKDGTRKKSKIVKDGYRLSDAFTRHCQHIGGVLPPPRNSESSSS
jgi:hypothetical protein